MIYTKDVVSFGFPGQKPIHFQLLTPIPFPDLPVQKDHNWKKRALEVFRDGKRRSHDEWHERARSVGSSEGLWGNGRSRNRLEYLSGRSGRGTVSGEREYCRSCDRNPGCLSVQRRIAGRLVFREAKAEFFPKRGKYEAVLRLEYQPRPLRPPGSLLFSDFLILLPISCNMSLY